MRKQKLEPSEPFTIEDLATAEEVPGTWESLGEKVGALRGEIDKFEKHLKKRDIEGARVFLVWMIHAVHLIAYEWGWLESRVIVRKRLEECVGQANDIVKGGQRKALEILHRARLDARAILRRARSGKAPARKRRTIRNRKK